MGGKKRFVEILFDVIRSVEYLASRGDLVQTHKEQARTMNVRGGVCICSRKCSAFCNLA